MTISYRFGLPLVLAGLLIMTLPGRQTGYAQDRPVDFESVIGGNWFPQSAVDGPGVTTMPVETIARSENGRLSLYAQLGRIAFRSPLVMGGNAAQSGLSCQSCHLNGHRSPVFFLPGLSTVPGTVDVTASAFNAVLENHVSDQRKIPSLRGVTATTPYGWQGQESALRDFVRRVIVTEFRGREPSPWLLDGLVAYLGELRFKTNPNINAAGSPVGAATPSIESGFRIFTQSFPQDPKRSCSTCHIPRRGFQDGSVHDVGTGGFFNTPSLRNSDGPPFFHNGSETDLSGVIDHYIEEFDLQLSSDQAADLASYLIAVADAPASFAAITFDNEFSDLTDMYQTATRLFDHEWDDPLIFTLSSIRREIGRIYGRFVLPNNDNSELATARSLLRNASACLSPVAQTLSDGDPTLPKRTAARATFTKCTGQLHAARPTLQTAVHRFNLMP